MTTRRTLSLSDEVWRGLRVVAAESIDELSISEVADQLLSHALHIAPVGVINAGPSATPEQVRLIQQYADNLRTTKGATPVADVAPGPGHGYNIHKEVSPDKAQKLAKVTDALRGSKHGTAVVTAAALTKKADDLPRAADDEEPI